MPQYTLEQTSEKSFDLLRDGKRFIGVGGGRRAAERFLAEYRDQEGAAREALATGEPEAVCELGWHSRTMPRPLIGSFGAGAMYFSFGARIGEAGGTLVYRVAPGPFLYAARTVKQLGRLTPWVCAVCGTPIGDPTSCRPRTTHVSPQLASSDSIGRIA